MHCFLKKIIATVIVSCFFHCTNAQVKTKIFTETIPSHFLPIRGLVSRCIVLNPPSRFKELKREAETDENVGGRERFALSSLVNIDLLTEARLFESNGSSTYFLTIKAPAAHNISIQFSNFFLSENSLLSIYTGNELTDSITSKENNKNRIWSTRTYQGDYLNLVLKIPSKEKSLASLKIGKVLFGFKKFGVTTLFGEVGASASCMKNVACPEGNDWPDERKAVALINANGAWGTGTLIRNTCNTNTPYLLTAKHGLDGEEKSWVFQFFYYSTDCSTNTGYREDVQFSGCTVKAYYSGSDFALLLLDQTPAANSGLYYAGWNRDPNAYITSTTLFHHPKGDVMKISKDYDQPQKIRLSNGIDCWRLTLEWGGTQGGSSGGPFFDQWHRIIGQVFGVKAENDDNPCHPEVFGGRFDVSWTGGGTSGTRLSDWLDPSNSGVIVTNTTNVSNLIPAPIQGSFLPITGNSVICGSSGTFSVTGVLPGSTITWSLSGPYANGGYLPLQNICTLTSNGSQATLTKLSNGTINLTATISNCDGTNQYASTAVTFGVPELYYNAGYYSNNIGLTQPIEGTATFINSSSVYITLESSGNNSYLWEFDGGSTNANYYTSYPPTFGYAWWNTPINPYDYIGFSIHTTNVCGTRSDPVFFYYEGPYQYYAVSPNPAMSTFTISVIKPKRNLDLKEKQQSEVAISRIQLIDKTGNVILDKQYPSDTRTITVNVSTLKPDMYIVRIFNNDKIELHKIIVKR